MAGRKSNDSTGSTGARSKNVFIKGFPDETTLEDVEKRFSKYGKVRKIALPTRYDKELEKRVPKGYAIIKFEDQSGADQVFARKDQGKAFTLKGVELSVDRDQSNSNRNSGSKRGGGGQRAEPKDAPKNVFVRGIPEKCTVEELEKLFKQWGNLRTVAMPTRYDKEAEERKNRGFAVVKFEDEESAAKCLATNKPWKGKWKDFVLEKGVIMAKSSGGKSPRARKERGEPKYSDTNVFARNIPEGATEEDVQKIFGKFGKIRKIAIPTRYDKELDKRVHRGFAVIKYEDDGEAKKCMQKIQRKSIFKLKGETLEVEKGIVGYQPAEPSPRGSKGKRRSSGSRSDKIGEVAL